MDLEGIKDLIETKNIMIDGLVQELKMSEDDGDFENAFKLSKLIIKMQKGYINNLTSFIEEN